MFDLLISRPRVAAENAAPGRSPRALYGRRRCQLHQHPHDEDEVSGRKDTVPMRWMKRKERNAHE